jgi:hypothetical protein
MSHAFTALLSVLKRVAVSLKRTPFGGYDVGQPLSWKAALGVPHSERSVPHSAAHGCADQEL